MESAIERLACGICGTCRSVGGRLHTEEARQAREETAREEGKPHDAVLQLEVGHDTENGCQDDEHNDHHLVLLFQVSHGSLTDMCSDFLHQVSTFVLFHHLLVEDESKCQGQDRGRQHNVNNTVANHKIVI